MVQLSPTRGPPEPSRIGLLQRAWNLSLPGAGRKKMVPPLPAAAGSHTAFPDSNLTRKTPPSSTSPGKGDRISTLDEVQLRTPIAERTLTSLPPPARRRTSHTNFMEPPSELSTAYEQRAEASRGTGVDQHAPASLAGLSCRVWKLRCRSCRLGWRCRAAGLLARPDPRPAVTQWRPCSLGDPERTTRGAELPEDTSRQCGAPHPPDELPASRTSRVSPEKLLSQYGTNCSSMTLDSGELSGSTFDTGLSLPTLRCAAGSTRD